MVSCSVSASVTTKSEVSVSSPSVIIGNKITLAFKVWEGADAFVDPDTITLTIQPPGDSGAVTPEFDQTSAGHWQSVFDTDGQPAGVYKYRWEGDGNGKDCAAEGTFEVLASQVV